jgi:hypothetical protein
MSGVASLTAEGIAMRQILGTAVPLTFADVLRRTAIRLGFCTFPYLLMAYAVYFFWADKRFFNGLGYVLILAIPALGLAIDLRRLLAARPRNDD